MNFTIFGIDCPNRGPVSPLPGMALAHLTDRSSSTALWRCASMSTLINLLHFDSRANWIFVTNVFLFAVFACCWVIRTGDVWGVMGWHGGWNWLLAVGFELRVTALDAHVPALLVKLTPVGPDYLTGGIQGPEGSIVCTLELWDRVSPCACKTKVALSSSGVDTSVPGGGVNAVRCSRGRWFDNAVHFSFKPKKVSLTRRFPA